MFISISLMLVDRNRPGMHGDVQSFSFGREVYGSVYIAPQRAASVSRNVLLHRRAPHVQLIDLGRAGDKGRTSFEPGQGGMRDYMSIKHLGVSRRRNVQTQGPWLFWGTLNTGSNMC